MTRFYLKVNQLTKFDLHVHASERSGCARIDEESQIRAAINAGLDALAFTDHNKLVSARRLIELNQKYAPFQIFTGIEVDADRHHWLVIGIHDPILEIQGWNYPDLLRFVRRRNGYIILAHPFRYHSSLAVDFNHTENGQPDGVEIKSMNTAPEHEQKITELAQQYGLALFNNSDAHWAGVVGNYVNELPVNVRGDRELIEALRLYQCVPQPNIPC